MVVMLCVWRVRENCTGEWCGEMGLEVENSFVVCRWNNVGSGYL